MYYREKKVFSHMEKMTVEFKEKEREKQEKMCRS